MPATGVTAFGRVAGKICSTFLIHRSYPVARTVTLKGKTLSLEGPALKAGDKAPDATLRKSLVESLRLSDTKGKTRVISVVPSLDTPVCSMQTKRFNDEATKLTNVDFITVSCDLPTAQARFCADALNESYFGWNPGQFATRSEHNQARAESQLRAARSLIAQRSAAIEVVERAFR